ncbi:MAG TPA: hypothetical protein VGP92_18500 [Acidimicrobiia bacterium]|jgi:hypothetical protein|nr:hypothetical protein [Acidimicrobiia bacterium]
MPRASTNTAPNFAFVIDFTMAAVAAFGVVGGVFTVDVVPFGGAAGVTAAFDDPDEPHAASAMAVVKASANGAILRFIVVFIDLATCRRFVRWVLQLD